MPSNSIATHALLVVISNTMHIIYFYYHTLYYALVMYNINFRVDDNHIPDQMYESVDQQVAYGGMHSRVQLVPASSKTCESASMEE